MSFLERVPTAKSSAGYQRIRNIAEATVRSILTQDKVISIAALRALLQALKEVPRSELLFLIYGSLSNPIYEPQNGNRPQNYAQLRQELLLESAEPMYKDLLAKAVNNTLSSAANMLYDHSSFSDQWSARKANQYWK
jgi:CBS-domain-containing membrane protein